jgi:hypothetical protein
MLKLKIPSLFVDQKRSYSNYLGYEITQRPDLNILASIVV